jgi:hypothetical protein
MDDIDRIEESPGLSLVLLAVYPSIVTDAVGYCSSAHFFLNVNVIGIRVNNTKCPLLRTQINYTTLQ